MTHIPCGSNLNSPNFECEIDGSDWLEELDYLPLIRRRNLLLTTEQKSKSLIGVALKEEDKLSESQDVFSFPFAASEMGVQLLEEEKNQNFIIPSGPTPGFFCSKTVVDSSLDQCSQNGTCSQNVEMPGNSDYNGTNVNTFVSSEQIACNESAINSAQPEKIDSSFSTLSGNLSLSEVHPKGKVACLNDFAGFPVSAVTVKSEISDHSTYDHLDHISLRERQKILLSRKHFGLESTVMEGIPGPLSEEIMQQPRDKRQGGTSSGTGNAFVSTRLLYGNRGRNDSHLRKTSMMSSPDKIIDGSSSTIDQYSVPLNNSSDCEKDSESDRKCSSETVRPNLMQLSACWGQEYVPTYTTIAHCPTSSAPVKIKDETWDDGVFDSQVRNVSGNFSLNVLSVKSEPRVSSELTEDEVDQMRLRDRLDLLASGYGSELSRSGSYGCLVEMFPPAKYSPIALEYSKPMSPIRQRKRKRTATDSVATALEEDAPGLLQVLIEKGVLVNEIRLYGETESDDALDESLCEDSFSKLEAVISKLFSQRESLFKLAPIRCAKTSRASYCLPCLISLVEQTRYLQFRNWPVEWGWCRDLQSFIFVFARHNRIVLERPEYGYATYFFELVDALPIDWQIKRLVTAMKLTGCSRISLIENKALWVGEDLTEADAQVLMEYGWEPNTGLGTMLKYRDRVVHHDGKNDDSSEWRSKIGKLLMDGYNGGTLVTSNIPKNVAECRNQEIKLEL